MTQPPGDFVDPKQQLEMMAQKYGQPQPLDMGRVLQQLAEAMATDNGPLRLRQATVVAVNSVSPPTVDLLLGDTTVPGARYEFGYLPIVGDTVWVLRNGPDTLVLGNLEPNANAIETASGAGVVTSGQWYRLAYTVGGDTTGADIDTSATTGRPRAHGMFAIQEYQYHSRIEFAAGTTYNKVNQLYATVRSAMQYGGYVFTKVRFLTNGTNNRTYLEVFCNVTPTGSTHKTRVSMRDNTFESGWRLQEGFGTVLGSIPAGYTATEFVIADPSRVFESKLAAGTTLTTTDQAMCPALTLGPGQWLVVGAFDFSTTTAATGNAVGSLQVAGVAQSNQAIKGTNLLDRTTAGQSWILTLTAPTAVQMFARVTSASTTVAAATHTHMTATQVN